MLVVVKDRDVHLFAQALFDDETVGGLDVLKVDATERRPKQLDSIDELVRVFGVQLKVNAIHIGERLEEDSFALHHRLGGERPDVPRPRTAVPLEITATMLPRAV